ncbi:MAG TPA: succinate dehydrogenase [Nitrososphaerales archaeon]|nr:succinate dehydrogenase [Nitrososphaerales archaeon]
MRESTMMQLQYATAVLAIVLVTVHLLMQGVLVPYGEAVSFEHVLSVYRNAVDGGLLEVLLVVVLTHGFNGLRIILLEWRQSAGWTRGVNWAVLIVTLATIAYGTRTVILAATGQVS